MSVCTVCTCRLIILRSLKESFHDIVSCRHMSRRWNRQTNDGSIYCLLPNHTKQLPSRFTFYLWLFGALLPTEVSIPEVARMWSPLIKILGWEYLFASKLRQTMPKDPKNVQIAFKISKIFCGHSHRPPHYGERTLPWLLPLSYPVLCVSMPHLRSSPPPFLHWHHCLLKLVYRIICN